MFSLYLLVQFHSKTSWINASFVGGAVGYMAGSDMGEKIAKGRQKIRDKVVEEVVEVGKKLVTTVKNVAEDVMNFVTAIF